MIHAVMRALASRFAFCLALAAIAVAPDSASVPAAEAWPALPELTRGVLLVTGGDHGAAQPISCNGGFGGALYRPTFAAWHERVFPEVPVMWMSTGDVASLSDEYAGQRAGIEQLYATLAETGYDAVGVGALDLDALAPASLESLAKELGLRLVATNLVVHETGKPPFDDSVLIERGGLRVGVVSVMRHFPARVWGDVATGAVLTTDPLEALPPVLARLRERVDLVVLLSTLSSGELQTLLAKLDGVDVAASGWSSYGRVDAESVGDTKVLWLGSDGVFLGHVTAGRDALDARAVHVGDEFLVDPSTGALREAEAHKDSAAVSGS